MLSKEDYRDYLDQIMDVENKMMKAYDKCAGRIEDVALQEVFNKLASDEKRHAGIVKRLMELLDV